MQIFVTVVIGSPSGWSCLLLYCLGYVLPQSCFAGVLFAQTLDSEYPSMGWIVSRTHGLSLSVFCATSNCWKWTLCIIMPTQVFLFQERGSMWWSFCISFGVPMFYFVCCGVLGTLFLQWMLLPLLTISPPLVSLSPWITVPPYFKLY